MFGHYDVSHNHEPVFLSHLFESRKEAKSAARMTEKRQSSITGASDKVQVMRAVGAMQAAGHDKSHSIGSIVPALAKNARTGHPQFGNGKQNPEPRATRPSDFQSNLTKLAQKALDTLAEWGAAAASSLSDIVIIANPCLTNPNIQFTAQCGGGPPQL